MQMGYNGLVKSKTSFADPVRVIRFAAILWIVYLVIMAAISQSTISQSIREPWHGDIETSYYLYYILLGLVALLCLGLSYWPWIQERLGRAFIPVIIAIITVIPMSVTWLTNSLLPFNPTLGAEGSVLRLLPFLLVGFLLVAWQYSWEYMLLIVLGITGLNFGAIWSFSPSGTPPFRGALTVPLIQAAVLLAVGFSISYLMSTLRRQQQSLEAANTRLTHYASTLEQLATTRERNRLARELHDTLAHTLSGLSVQLETIKAYWDVDQNMARSSLERSIATAHSGLEETRRSLKALRASPLDDLGLAQAIKTMVEGTASRANLALELSIADKMPALSPDVEQCVYRVAQEAVTNVVNHANAKNLTVKLEFAEGKLTLVVHDDGVGFDIEKVNKSSQFGLIGMQERAQLIGGELNVTSKPGHGTTVQLTV
jgi:signal transduction histidine kinase